MTQTPATAAPCKIPPLAGNVLRDTAQHTTSLLGPRARCCFTFTSMSTRSLFAEPLPTWAALVPAVPPPQILWHVFTIQIYFVVSFFFFFWFTLQLSHGARAASRMAAPPGTPPRCAPRRRRAEPLIDVFSTKPPKSLTAPPASVVPGHVPRRGDFGEQDAAGAVSPRRCSSKTLRSCCGLEEPPHAAGRAQSPANFHHGFCKRVVQPLALPKALPMLAS